MKNVVGVGPSKGMTSKRKRPINLRRCSRDEGVMVGWPSILLLVLLLSTNPSCVGSQGNVDSSSIQDTNSSARDNYSSVENYTLVGSPALNEVILANNNNNINDKAFPDTDKTTAITTTTDNNKNKNNTAPLTTTPGNQNINNYYTLPSTPNVDSKDNISNAYTNTAHSHAHRSARDTHDATDKDSSSRHSHTTTYSVPSCQNGGVFSMKIDGPNYRSEIDGRDAKVSWRFPSWIHGTPGVRFTFTDFNRNLTFDKECTRYQDPNSRRFPSAWGFGFYGGGYARPRGSCSCSGRYCDFSRELNPETNYSVEMLVLDDTNTRTCPFLKTTGAGVPLKISGLVVLLGGLKDREHDTFKIGIHAYRYSNSHGIIRNVSIALARNEYLEGPRDGYRYDLWNGHMGLREFPSYSDPEALYRVYEGINTSLTSFVFGGDDDKRNKSCQDCNYPLLPQTYYRFKVRVITNNGFRDVAVKTFRTKEQPSFQSVYIMAISVFVVIVILVALALLAGKCLSPSPGALERSVSLDLSWMLKAEELKRAQKPIQLTALSAVMDTLFRNDRAALLQEFAELQQVTPSNKDQVAATPANAQKNRYSNIRPYDESRVILRRFKAFYHSDYINASYVHGYKRAKMFIAAQGPLYSTRQDFWRMVWEKQVQFIVMLTACVQNGQEKCYKYWPEENEKLEYALEQLTVTALREIVNSHFVARKFSLVKKGNKPREVFHYHFVAWPDMGCPTSPDQLLNFLSYVKNAQNPDGPPIVVHCSAGVGRTGTFIGLYNLMSQMEDTGDTVDIFNTVLRMRCHRPHMVQTPDQYAFIYQSVLTLHGGLTGEQTTSFMDDPGQATQPPNAHSPPGVFRTTGKESGYTSADDTDSSDTRYLGQFHPTNYPDPPPYPAGFGDPESDEEEELLLSAAPISGDADGSR